MIQNTNVNSLSQQQQQQLNTGVAYGELPKIPLDLDINNISDRIVDSSSSSRKVMGMFNPDSLIRFPIFFGLFFGGIYALQTKFAPKFAGKYAKSFLGKCTSFADNLSESKYGKPVVDKMFKGWDWACKQTSKIISKSKVLEALSMRTQPVRGMALSQLSPGLHFSVSDAKDVIECIQKKHKGALSKYTPEYINKMTAEPEKYINSIIKDLSALPDEKLEIGKRLKRTIYISQSVNTLKAISGQIDSKTKLGKLLPGWMVMGLESLTGAMLGDAKSIGGQAVGLAMSANAAIDAPKGEKLSKSMEEFVQIFAFFAAMPLAMKLMHSIGGLKYTGMSKAQIEKFRTRLAQINSTPIKDDRAHSAFKTELNEVFKKTSKWYYKPFRAIGNIFAIGLERLNPHEQASFSKFTHKLKGALGHLRFPLFLLGFSPLVTDPFIRLAHLIFGRPTDSLLGNLKEEKVEEFMKNPKIKMDDVFNASNARVPIGTQQVPVDNIPGELDAVNTPPQINLKPQPVTNKQAIHPQTQQQQAAAPQVAPAVQPQQPKTNQPALATQQPQSQDALGASALNSMVGRSYVPSSEPVIPIEAPPPQLSAKREQALKKADYAEQAALELLNKGGH